MGGGFSLAKKWEVSGFSMPELVFASANHPWLYVSNVDGPAPGFISRVAKDEYLIICEMMFLCGNMWLMF